MSHPNAVSLALFDGPMVLLIQRTRPPYQGHWTLPGGRVEAGESADDAVMREIREELGIQIAAPIAVTQRYFGKDQTYVLQVYAARYSGEPISPNDEIQDWIWREATNVSDLDVTPGLPETLNMAATTLTGV